MATTTSTPQAILDAVGGAENITHLTHCATRLRFELKDASVVDKGTVEKIPGVMGAVPQSGDRYQIIIGGAVQSVYNDIMKLPAMAGGASSSSAKSDADIKAAARAKARGKNAYVDAFFEYLSDGTGSFWCSRHPRQGSTLMASVHQHHVALGVLLPARYGGLQRR